jgi:hypothetical protein
MMSTLLDNLHELTCERLDIRSLLIDKLRAHENQYLMALYVTIEDYYQKRGRRGFRVIKAEVS